jgi:hypothetical protein
MNSFVFIALLLFAQTANDSDRVTIPFKDPTRPGTVEVRLFQGNLTITTHNGRDVIVTSKNRRNRIVANAEVQGLRRLTAGGFAAAEDNNVVSVRGDAFEKVDLEIQVPAVTNLKIQSTFGGNVNVTGVDGDIEVTNLNGAITLTDVSGSVVTHSMNGNIAVTMRKVAPEKPMAFTSANGNVDVTLPADTRANLKLRTMLGDIYTDFDVKIISPQLSSLNASPQGRHTNLERAITGTINGGGPDFELRTMNGNLLIRRAK